MKRYTSESATLIRQTFLAAFAMLAFLSFQTLAQEAVLHEIVVSKLSGNRVQIKLVADGLLNDPGSFSTSSPPRIAFDFFGMKNAVLSLTVLPQITPDDRVIMDVQITQDTFASAVSDTLNTKRIVTQVLSDNGETIVIGGIYQQDEFNNVTKVPILGDLPIVGNAFRKKSVQNNRTELLIFLTPRIISPKLNLG
ncbi:MAG: hypothetical protein HOJ88_11345 [Proteobacteria bacterium]|jgi:hypothetical protein|nr:hypothetical protein [Pseudomonadota bacterium]